MDTFDFVIIGAGPAGEAAAFKARELGATVAIADDRWFGGSCPFIGCVPSKSLLNAAAQHAANPAAYDWPRASARRDYMVNRAAGRARAGRHEPRAGRSRRRARSRSAGRPTSRAAVGSRSITTEPSTSWPVATSSSRSGRGRRSRRSRASSASRPGRTVRRPWPASCRRACSSSAAARRAASSPRSTPGSASRPRSSSPGRGSCRPTIPGTRRRSRRRSSATG